jgi:hypothetical protein
LEKDSIRGTRATFFPLLPPIFFGGRHGIPKSVRLDFADVRQKKRSTGKSPLLI